MGEEFHAQHSCVPRASRRTSHLRLAPQRSCFFPSVSRSVDTAEVSRKGWKMLIWRASASSSLPGPPVCLNRRVLVCEIRPKPFVGQLGGGCHLSGKLQRGAILVVRPKGVVVRGFPENDIPGTCPLELREPSPSRFPNGYSAHPLQML